VDTSGNVALQSDYGNPFTVNAVGGVKVYLPLIRR